MKVKDNGGEKTLAPEGIHLARIVWIADLGTQETKFGDKRQLYIAFELVDETHIWSDDKGEETFVMGKTYTYSMGSKSSLRKDLKAWLGKDPDPGEEGFDMETVLGTCGQVQVEHADKDNTTYANIIGLMSLSKKQAKAVEEGMQPEILFSLEPEEFDMDELKLLPEWMQNKICETEEYEIAVEETEGLKAKKGRKAAKKLVEEEDEYEEEEAPAPKRRAKKVVEEEDEEDDLPILDSPRPKRRSKKVVEEEEEEEAPRPRIKVYENRYPRRKRR